LLLAREDLPGFLPIIIGNSVMSLSPNSLPQTRSHPELGLYRTPDSFTAATAHGRFFTHLTTPLPQLPFTRPSSPNRSLLSLPLIIPVLPLPPTSYRFLTNLPSILHRRPSRRPDLFFPPFPILSYPLSTSAPILLPPPSTFPSNFPLSGGLCLTRSLLRFLPSRRGFSSLGRASLVPRASTCRPHQKHPHSTVLTALRSAAIRATRLTWPPQRPTRICLDPRPSHCWA
jgi:hypothetical protein